VTTPPPCPYPGLRPFFTSEADVFFGRDEHIGLLLDRLAEGRFLAIAGPSGCGKTSLVEAGLVPALEGGLLRTGVSGWRIERIRPGDHPLHRLAHVFLDLYRLTAVGYEDEGGNVDDFRQELRYDPHFFTRMLDHVAEKAPRKVENVLLLVDRFEEVFYRPRSDDIDEIHAFVALLLAAAALPCKVPIYVVIVMRAEFLGECNAFAGLPEQINRSLFLVPGLSDEQYRLAIVQPAHATGGDVADELVERLIHDLHRRRDPLLLLQHALSLMWHVPVTTPTADNKNPSETASHSRQLTLDHYRAIGGMADSPPGETGGSLATCFERTFDECLRGFSPEERRIAEAMFLALSDRREIRLDTPHRVRLAQIAAEAGVPHEQVLPVIELFRRPGQCFLITRSGAPLSPSDTLEVSHESVFRLWSRWGEWRSQNKGAGGAASGGSNMLRECDVFLSYHSADQLEVVEIAKELRKRGIDVWLDIWEIPPGSLWQKVIEEQIGNSRTAAVFFGKETGPIQWEEEQAFVIESTGRTCPVIPVILRSFASNLPRLLRNRTYVDFRKSSPDPLGELIWGITGKRPSV
jgi:energy-coupling factor transporter ATP-binding protein EcfA2